MVSLKLGKCKSLEANAVPIKNTLEDAFCFIGGCILWGPEKVLLSCLMCLML